jgi:hypothetical protein
MLRFEVMNSALKICRLIPLGLAMLVCVPLWSMAAPLETGSGGPGTSPGRISTNFRVHTVGTQPSQRLESEVIKVLETWHHRFLVAFESEPPERIQVLLHPINNFHRDTGAPHWANGVYTAQGTIHAAIGGVARVEPDLERRLAHELAHAFIARLSGGEAPRWLQEGLAQALSDRRPAGALAPAEMAATTPAELGYSGSLAFARDLLASHGHAVLRDTLAGMGTGLDVDEAFRAHTGASTTELFARWQAAAGELMARLQHRENDR